MQDENGVKTHSHAEELVGALGYATGRGGYLKVKEATIAGLVETPSGIPDIGFHLVGEKSSRYVIAILERRQSVDIAKQILRLLEPQALDPQSEIHERLRRIDHNLGKLLAAKREQ